MPRISYEQKWPSIGLAIAVSLGFACNKYVQMPVILAHYIIHDATTARPFRGPGHSGNASRQVGNAAPPSSRIIDTPRHLLAAFSSRYDNLPINFSVLALFRRAMRRFATSLFVCVAFTTDHLLSRGETHPCPDERHVIVPSGDARWSSAGINRSLHARHAL